MLKLALAERSELCKKDLLQCSTTAIQNPVLVLEFATSLLLTGHY